MDMHSVSVLMAKRFILGEFRYLSLNSTILIELGESTKPGKV